MTHQLLCHRVTRLAVLQQSNVIKIIRDYSSDILRDGLKKARR
ncbi:hypothetical protein DSUL_60189 [Desulfovibrionales bacterium]